MGTLVLFSQGPVDDKTIINAILQAFREHYKGAGEVGGGYIFKEKATSNLNVELTLVLTLERSVFQGNQTVDLNEL